MKWLCTLALGCGAICAALGDSQLRLLETGEGHGDEIDARSGEKWVALSPVKGGFAWRQGALTVGRVGDLILDQGDEMTGKDVRFPGARPVFLVRGWDLPLTAVKTVF